MKRIVDFTAALCSLTALLPSTWAASGEGIFSFTENLQNWIHEEQIVIEEVDADLQKENGAVLLPVFAMSGAVRSSVPRSPVSAFVQLRVQNQLITLTDVPVALWFAPYVRDAAERGVVSGYRDSEGRFTGLFGPQNSVTLEELAKMTIHASGLGLSNCPEDAKNPTALDRWSNRYISCAEFHGFAVYADGTESVTRQATRAEVAMTVLQAFGIEMTDVSPGGEALDDVSRSTLFSSAIYTAVRDGVMTGDTDTSGKLLGKFRPSDPINRAETAKIISVAMQLYGGF